MEPSTLNTRAPKRAALRLMLKGRLNAYITKLIDAATIGRPIRG